MPYIITIMPAGSAAHPERMTRRAVATLAEAREAIVAAVVGTSDSEAVAEDARWTYADTLPEAGGTIGPLPDGTVIEVTHAPVSDPVMHAGWVEIYNRNHAQGS